MSSTSTTSTTTASSSSKDVTTDVDTTMTSTTTTATTSPTAPKAKPSVTNRADRAAKEFVAQRQQARGGGIRTLFPRDIDALVFAAQQDTDLSDALHTEMDFKLRALDVLTKMVSCGNSIFAKVAEDELKNMMGVTAPRRRASTPRPSLSNIEEETDPVMQALEEAVRDAIKLKEGQYVQQVLDGHDCAVFNADGNAAQEHQWYPITAKFVDEHGAPLEIQPRKRMVVSVDDSKKDEIPTTSTTSTKTGKKNKQPTPSNDEEDKTADDTEPEEAFVNRKIAEAVKPKAERKIAKRVKPIKDDE